MAALVFLIFLALFAVFIFGVFSVAEGRGHQNTRHTNRSYPVREYEPVARTRSPQVSRRPQARASGQAREAMRQAGYKAGPDFVQIADIGLLAYRTITEPRLIRQGDVMMDMEYLRPFAELWVPFRSRGPIRFELVDGDGRIRYADEEHYELERGRNTLLPGTWLPLAGKAIEPEDDWLMRVSVGQTLLAVHTFGWQQVGGGVIQQYVEADGEISPELRQMLQSAPRRSMSLSDLLDDQEDD